ncbi:MAG: ROK family protein [Halothermotrichaceae bacterium]
MSEYYIGVDLGGTKIYTALADETGKVLAKIKLLTESNRGIDKVFENIVESINIVIKDADIDRSSVRRIGVGSPGPLNIDEGIIYTAPNLENWVNIKIVKILEDKTGIPVLLENDANAAALGEKWFGAGKEANNMLYMTVSTGIGGGIIVNKKIYHGSSDTAGEVGHMIIKPDGPTCGCGNPGCLETFASGTAVARKGRQVLHKSTILQELSKGNPDNIDGALVAQAAELGDFEAQKIWREEGYYLGIGLANLINIFNFDMILLGGGVMNSWELFADEMFKNIKKYAFESTYSQAVIKKAALGSEVGVIGAVAVAMGDRLLS